MVKKYQVIDQVTRKAEMDDAVERFPDELVDELLAGTRGEDLLGRGGLIGRLAGRLVERSLQAELSEQMGYEAGSATSTPHEAGNTYNGTSAKTLKTEYGDVAIRVPRDRDGDFEPKLIAKGQRRLGGLDEQIIALYAGGMTVSEVCNYLTSMYDTQIGKDVITRVTDAVLEDVKVWQTRPLEPVYPIVLLDALIVKVRDGGSVVNKPAYLAIGVTPDGDRETLGTWFAPPDPQGKNPGESAKFWMHVLNSLKQRGVTDILVACVDGLTGFTDAIETIFPHTTVQTCIVHLIRASMRYVPYKDRRKVARSLRAVYTAIDADAAADALDLVDREWGQRYPSLIKTWRNAWEHVTPFLAFPADVRRVIYTTNAIENLNRQIRKIIKTRGHFPTDDAARKLIWLAITNAEKGWRRVYNWDSARVAFAIHFEDRMP